MIIKLFNFQYDIAVSDEFISILEVKKKRLFSILAQSFYAKINGDDALEDIELFDGEKEIRFDKGCLYVSDPLQVDFSDKKIQNALLEKLMVYCKDNQELMRRLELLHSNVVDVLVELSNEIDLEIVFSLPFDIGKLLKFADVKLAESKQVTYIEKLYHLIEVVSQLHLFKLIVFCNLKSYLDEEDLKELYKMLLYVKIPVVLLESTISTETLLYERKLVIDVDYDEFIVETKDN